MHNSIMCTKKKNSAHALIKMYFIDKNANYHLSFQRVTVVWLVEGLASVDVDGG